MGGERGGGWNPAYTPLHSMKKTPGKSWQIWAWLGMPGHTQPKVLVSHATFH